MIIENKVRVLRPVAPEAVEPDEMQQARCLALRPEELRQYPHLKDKSDEELMAYADCLLRLAVVIYRQLQQGQEGRLQQAA